jgi:hypothetical protein
VRPTADLIRALAAERGQTGEPPLAVGTVMFCGAIGAIGGIRPASRFEMELEDPVLARTLRLRCSRSADHWVKPQPGLLAREQRHLFTGGTDDATFAFQASIRG